MKEEESSMKQEGQSRMKQERVYDSNNSLLANKMRAPDQDN